MPGRPAIRARREAEAAQAAAKEVALSRTKIERFAEPATYAPERIDEMLELSDQGYAPVEVAAVWNVDEETVQAWSDAHPAFAAAVSRARVRERAWWVARARTAIRDDNNRFPAGAWSHVMRARFPEYADAPGTVVNINLVERLVHVDLTQPPAGLLGEQGVIDAEALPALGSSDSERSDGPARSGQTGAHELLRLDPLPPFAIPARGGGAGEKRVDDFPDMGRPIDSAPPPPTGDEA